MGSLAVELILFIYLLKCSECATSIVYQTLEFYSSF